MTAQSLQFPITGLPGTLRKADSGNQAGVASLINIVSLHLNDPDVQQEQLGMMVTAVRANNGRIKLIVWRLSEDGNTLERLGDNGSSGEPVNGIATARLSIQRVVTAVRTNQGRLKLIVWRISNNGQTVEVLGESTADDEFPIASSELSVVTMNGGQAVTVARDANNRLLVTNWSINQEGIVNQEGDSGSAGDHVTEFAATRLAIGRLTVAVRTATGRLVLQNWATPPGGNVTLIDSSSPNDAGDGRHISMTLGSEIVTAVRTRQANLKLIRWDGGLQRLGDSAQQGGRASRTAITSMSSDLYMTAVRGNDGLLAVSSWRVRPEETTLQKLSATNPSDQESIGEVAIALLFNGRAVTAVEDRDGRLKLIAWELTLA